MKKIREIVKNFFKNNYKEIIGMLVFAIIMLMPIPYYIYAGGGTINTENRIAITNQYESKGSFSLAYVRQLRGTIPSYLLSFLNKDYERVKVSDYKIDKEEKDEDVFFRDKLSLQNANQSAVKLAYLKANKEFIIKSTKHYIVYVSNDADTSLKIGDVLLKVNGKALTDLKVYEKVIEDSNVSDKLDLEIERDGKVEKAYIMVKTIDDKKLTGIAIMDIYDYETNPKALLSFESNETGPSGGLMVTLSIYNKLVSEDITKGLNIVGTGAINEDGTVSEIGGVKYKLQGAVAKKADVFICPLEINYDEAMKIKKEKNYNIKIIGVSSFDDALEKLRAL